MRQGREQGEKREGRGRTGRGATTAPVPHDGEASADIRTIAQNQSKETLSPGSPKRKDTEHKDSCACTSAMASIEEPV